jgi:phage terminase large subunit GpA-like protein
MNEIARAFAPTALRDRATICLLRAKRDGLKTPPRLSLSEWAARYAYIPVEGNASPGKFEAYGYQNGLMDAVTDPSVKLISVMKSARIGYTRCLDNIIGYFLHHDPAPILVVQPREGDADDYSRTEILPMVKDTPVLRDLVGDFKGKDPDQRLSKRTFKNGASITFIGANSAEGFRRITVRVVAFDEIDSYPTEGVGKEGDQIALGIKRTETYWNRKIIQGSTPKILGASRIEKAWLESDQRRYHVPCPHCGEKQVLKWQNLRWDKGDKPDPSRPKWIGEHRPETAHFVCEASGCIIEEHHKNWMIDNGEWIASQPFHGHAGYHIWAGYSLNPNACWSELASEWLLKRNNPRDLQTFVNTTLGEPWEDRKERIEGRALYERAENYGAQNIPDAIRSITGGVDIQDNRIEVQIIGWGERDESWVIDYQIFYGDPAQQTVWAQLDNFLMMQYSTDGGRALRIRAACVDIGGHHGNAAIQFCKQRRGRNIYPVKGIGGPRPIWPKLASATKLKETIFLLGVDTAKDAIYGRLRIQKSGIGYIHFPAGEIFDEKYFSQLTSEYIKTMHDREGRPFRRWFLPEGKRNEALDTMVYALAAYHSLGRTSSMLAPQQWHQSARVAHVSQSTRPTPPSPFPAAKPRRSIASLLPR